MFLVEKVKEVFGVKPKEKTQLELIYQSLADSLETRVLLEYENGQTREDTEYINDVLNDMDRLKKLIKEEKEEKRFFKFRLPKANERIVSAFISGCSAITVALISYNFGAKCIEYDQDGNVVPTRLFSFGPKMPNPRT